MACEAVTQLIHRRVVPGSVEIIDAHSLDALAAYSGRRMATPGTGAVLLVEVDGSPEAVGPEILLVEEACRAAGALSMKRAASEAERDGIWQLRRDLSPALRKISTIKLNNDVVVPRGRVPELFALVDDIRRETGLPIACFGHAGDGNIHVNIMLPDAGTETDEQRAKSRETGKRAVKRLFEGVVALEGSISGEHGIGFTKAPYLGLELSREEIALMKRIKGAFDPKRHPQSG